jgi:SAM-dependent methyltransferase
MTNTDQAWQEWGQTEPYYGVAAEDKFYKANLDAHRAEFFDSGEKDINDTLTTYERHYEPLGHGSALDFGCGVGRLVLPLAKRFGRVLGVDVSTGMVAEAKRNCELGSVSNVEFRITGDYVAHGAEQFDFVNSYIALQRIPTKRGLHIIEQLARSVAPGGGSMLHVCLRRQLPWHKELAYQAENTVPLARIAINRLRRRPTRAPAMQMNEYDLRDVLGILGRCGLRNFFLEPEYHGPFYTMKIFACRGR